MDRYYCTQKKLQTLFTPHYKSTLSRSEFDPQPTRAQNCLPLLETAPPLQNSTKQEMNKEVAVSDESLIETALWDETGWDGQDRTVNFAVCLIVVGSILIDVEVACCSC